MKESAEIPLNPIISSSLDNNNGSEHLINDNSNISTNINNYAPINTNNIQIKRPQILVRSSQVVTIAYKGIMPQRVEDRTILCYKRRKFPKNIGSLTGYISTLIMFIAVPILFSICLANAKNIKAMNDSVKTSYNYIIAFMWIFSILSIITLTDVATADPGRQRGTPVIQSKFD